MECDTEITIAFFFYVSYAESTPIVGITYFEQHRGVILCTLTFFFFHCSLIFFIFSKLLQPMCSIRIVVRQPPHLLGYFEIWHFIIFMGRPPHEVCGISVESICNFFQAVAAILCFPSKPKCAQNVY